MPSETLLVEVQENHCDGKAKSLVSIVNSQEDWSRVCSCTLTEYKLSINLQKLIWSMAMCHWFCDKVEENRDFRTICGSRKNHISFSQYM